MESEIASDFRLVLFAGTFGMLLLTCAIIIFIYLYQRKLLKKKIAFQEIEDLLKKQELHSAYALLEGQDMERKRIAQELHDNLGSLLVTLSMYTDTAMDLSDANKKNELISKISQLTSKASDETRKLAHRIDSAALRHFGLETAVKDIKNAIEDTRDIEFSTSVIIEDEINSELIHNLYRVIQELVNNTLKYAHAKQMSIDVHQVEKESVSLIYKDNGVGFDPSKSQTGIGLSNIKSRVAKFSGTMNLESNENGTCVTIEIPLS